MRPEDRDAAYLWDMLDSARTVRKITTDATLDQYLRNRTLQLAVERAVEIIGEAASRISQGFREAHNEIPWQSIIGQRNVLAHEYGDIKQDRMWYLAATHIPELISRLERLLPPAPPEPET